MNKTVITTFNASEAKNRFGTLLDAAQRQPIAIQRHGRRVAFVVSPADMEALEDFYLGMKARAIMKKSKSLGVKRTKKYLESILDAGN